MSEVACFDCKFLAPLLSNRRTEEFICSERPHLSIREHELMELWDCTYFKKVDIIERYKWAIMGIL
jgi:hypothetical protein